MQLIPGLWYSPFPMAPAPPTIEGKNYNTVEGGFNGSNLSTNLGR